MYIVHLSSLQKGQVPQPSEVFKLNFNEPIHLFLHMAMNLSMIQNDEELMLNALLCGIDTTNPIEL